MQIGRNDSCPCGSGKKYKRCCLGKDFPLLNRSRRYFELKGKSAESLLHALAQKTFLTDWCYLNPCLPNGKELCDLLVVYDEVAIIWQIKSLKADDDGLLKPKELEKNLRQVVGAHRQVFGLKTPVRLVNPRRGEETFDPNSIKRVHLISVIRGECNQPMRFAEIVKDRLVHVFCGNFPQLVMNELDTVGDFCEFLRAVESIPRDARMVVAGGQEELLAHYLSNGRRLDWINREAVTMVEEGAWSAFHLSDAYLTYNKENESSYLWDQFIDMAHEGAPLEPRYELVARKMARPSRFDRRLLAKAFLEAHERADRETQNNVFRRTFDFEGMTYCFLFMHKPVSHEVRKRLLGETCFVARGMHPQNAKVIGIATEMKLREGHRFDFVLLQHVGWTTADQQRMEKTQQQFGIFRNPKKTGFDESEYHTSLGLQFDKQ
jgi:hypothetical protein